MSLFAVAHACRLLGDADAAERHLRETLQLGLAAGMTTLAVRALGELGLVLSTREPSLALALLMYAAEHPRQREPDRVALHAHLRTLAPALHEREQARVRFAGFEPADVAAALPPT
jgi:hypothetical protein